MMSNKKIKVAVLSGGPSAEHEVSLKSGENVLKNLDKEKYEAKKVLIDKSGKWEIPPEETKKSFDVAFIALHGTYGEDGTVQAILEEAGLPYTGSNALASALAMNKFLSLRLLQDFGLTIPQSVLVGKLDWQTNQKKVLDLIRYY